MIQREAHGQLPTCDAAPPLHAHDPAAFAGREWFEQQAECLRSEVHQHCQALMARSTSIEERISKFEQRVSEEGIIKSGVAASLDKRFATECFLVSQEHPVRESQLAEVWRQLTDEKNARQQFQCDIEGRWAASYTSVEECLAYLEELLREAAARCDEISAQVRSHQERFQQLEKSQQHSATQGASSLDSLHEQMKSLVKEAADAAVLQALQASPEISGNPSVFAALLVPEREARESQVHDVTVHLEGVVKHLETHKSSMEAHQRHVQDMLAREQAAREAFEQAFREQLAADRQAQPLQMQQVEVSASFASFDETAKHKGGTEMFVRDINDLMSVEKASREEGNARLQERLTWERVERERHTAKFEEVLAGQEALLERRHRQSMDRLDALNESVGIFDGIISAERKERTAEMRRIWDALDSHRHSLATDCVFKSVAHNKSESDLQSGTLLEPVQSMQAFRTKVTTVCSPRPAYASSSVACSEMPVLQQLPQYVGAARQVVRHSSTPSSPRVHVTPPSLASSSSAPRINGCCLSGDSSLRGRSLCAPAVSTPSNRGQLVGPSVFHWE